MFIVVFMLLLVLLGISLIISSQLLRSKVDNENNTCHKETLTHTYIVTAIGIVVVLMSGLFYFINKKSQAKTGFRF